MMGTAEVTMPKSVTEPLLDDHRKVRDELGALRAHLEQFNLAGLRSVCRSLKELLGPHALKEEASLYLIGMKRLKADNEKLPELFVEHHISADRLSNLVRLLYQPQLTGSEEHIRTLTTILIEELEDHMRDEEQVVFPALEELLDDELKELVLRRYRTIASDEGDDLSRTPLISVPEDPSSYNYASY